MFARVFRIFVAHEAVRDTACSEKLANVQLVYFRLLNKLPPKIESNRRRTDRQTAASSSVLYSPPFKSRSKKGGRKKCELLDINQSLR